MVYYYQNGPLEEKGSPPSGVFKCCGQDILHKLAKTWVWSVGVGERDTFGEVRMILISQYTMMVNLMYTTLCMICKATAILALVGGMVQ